MHRFRGKDSEVWEYKLVACPWWMTTQHPVLLRKVLQPVRWLDNEDHIYDQLLGTRT